MKWIVLTLVGAVAAVGAFYLGTRQAPAASPGNPANLTPGQTPGGGPGGSGGVAVTVTGGADTTRQAGPGYATPIAVVNQPKPVPVSPAMPDPWAAAGGEAFKSLPSLFQGLAALGVENIRADAAVDLATIKNQATRPPNAVSADPALSGLPVGSFAKGGAFGAIYDNWEPTVTNPIAVDYAAGYLNDPATLAAQSLALAQASAAENMALGLPASYNGPGYTPDAP